MGTSCKAPPARGAVFWTWWATHEEAGREGSISIRAFIHSSKQKNWLLLLLQPTDWLTGKRIFFLFLCVSLVTTVESGGDGTWSVAALTSAWWCCCDEESGLLLCLVVVVVVLVVEYQLCIFSFYFHSSNNPSSSSSFDCLLEVPIRDPIPHF